MTFLITVVKDGKFVQTFCKFTHTRSIQFWKQPTNTDKLSLSVSVRSLLKHTINNHKSQLSIYRYNISLYIQEINTWKSCTNNRKYAVHLFYNLHKKLTHQTYHYTAIYNVFQHMLQACCKVPFKNSHLKLQCVNHVAVKHCFQPEYCVVKGGSILNQ